jgi:hypothetical protein
MLMFQSVKMYFFHPSAMNPMSMQNLVTLAAMTGANGANLQVSPTGECVTDFFVKPWISMYTHITTI